MFNPSQADVRRFLCAVHAKTLSGAPMEAIETLASLWIAEHPEYHSELADADAAVARNYDETPGQTVAALNISGQANRTSAEVMQASMLPALLRAAQTISRMLGTQRN